MKNVLICSMIAILFLTNCSLGFGKGEKGSGNVTTEQRAVSSFDQIEITGVFTVYLSQGDTEHAEVEIDDNLQQYVELRNDGSKLVLSIKKGVQFGKTTKNNVYITLKDINELDIAGVCPVKTKGPLKCPRLKLDVHGVGSSELELYCDELSAKLGGVGSVELRGETTGFTIKKDGVGSLDAKNLKAAIVDIKNSGVGSASIYASQELYLKNSGVGSITYYGDAVIKSVESKGVGGVKKAD